MKRVILISVLLLFATWLGLKITQDPGYVLFSYGQTTVEMPLWFLLVLQVLGFILLYALIRGVSNTWSFKKNIRYRLRKRRFIRAQYRTNQGLIELNEGHFSSAEKLLARPLENGRQPPLINYLAAARAASEQGAYTRRENYLRKAYESMPDAKIAIGVTQAQLQIEHAQFEQALATLSQLHQVTPKHPYVLKLLLKVYVALEDWAALIQLLPSLKRYRVLTGESLEDFTIKIYLAQLDNLIVKKEQDALYLLWESMPRRLHKQPSLVASYSAHLIASGKHDLAESLLKVALKENLFESLLNLYVQLTASDQNKHLQQLEKWLYHSPNHALLLSCTARVCLRLQLWGKAQTYLIRSLELVETSEAHTLLGECYLALHDSDKALLHFQQS